MILPEAERPHDKLLAPRRRSIGAYSQASFNFPAARISPLMQEVERIMRRLAAAGSEMPDNPTLGELASRRPRSSVLKALQKLERAGHILVERDKSLRRVLVVATGQRTGWGQYRRGHAPYSANPHLRGRPKVAPAPIIRLGRPPPIIEKWDAIDVCQFIADDERSLGREPTVCGRAVLRGKSWCGEHHALLTRGGKPTSKKE